MKKILTLTSKEKNHDKTLKANRIKFFSRYTDILDKPKNKQEDKVSIRKKYKYKRKNVDKKVIKTHFKTVKHFKPDASRKESVEYYIVAQGFKNET